MNPLLKLARSQRDWVTPRVWAAVLGGSTPVVASGTAYLTGVSGGTTRNDITGDVGYEITIGGANVVVNQIGRYMISGNTGTHTVSIYGDRLNPTPTLVAQTSVSMTGTTPGTFKYGSITPVTLTAGQIYVVVSTETTSADLWLSADSTLTKTGVASLTASAYRINSTGAFTVDGVNNIGYGPPNYTYTSP